MDQFTDKNTNFEKLSNDWKNMITFGGIATILVLLGTILDIMIGSSTGGDVSALPNTAIERFSEFHKNPLMGLYHLDLLNLITQFIMIPVYIALYAVNRQTNNAWSFFTFIIFLTGTAFFITNNSALPMYDLSLKYYATSSENQKNLLAAAGEALLARGAHGSFGVFIGFFLSSIAGLMISLIMLSGNTFNKITSWFGITGSILMCMYVIFVTFIPGVKSLAMLFSLPGGLLLMGWMIMFCIRLFQLGRTK